ncbi:MAG: glucose-6-phosphate isomerase [Devosia nanyangense]|uniref:glucose-6-phosphate isomerase n=1 Tax=Devosia nanyangense TaxID=1228055 RepID=A0A933NZZ8_9HYPH|nr:glucose-6-phosphate isomerase [Devosia nanyangense]
MKIVEPTSTQIVLPSGELMGASGRYSKRVSELAGCYADHGAFQALVALRGDEIAYVVDQFAPKTTEGDLIFGTSTLEPGDVAGEFFMTRGHLHKKADRSEIYQCIAGRGVMLMETLEGRVAAIELVPGHIVYVPPYWIHRSVNVGPEKLVTLFCYPADAGQDYEIIAAAGGMASLIVSDGRGGWRQAPNLRYVGRADRTKPGSVE